MRICVILFYFLWLGDARRSACGVLVKLFLWPYPKLLRNKACWTWIMSMRGCRKKALWFIRCVLKKYRIKWKTPGKCRDFWKAWCVYSNRRLRMWDCNVDGAVLANQSTLTLYLVPQTICFKDWQTQNHNALHVLLSSILTITQYLAVTLFARTSPSALSDFTF